MPAGGAQLASRQQGQDQRDTDVLGEHCSTAGCTGGKQKREHVHLFCMGRSIQNIRVRPPPAAERRYSSLLRAVCLAQPGGCCVSHLCVRAGRMKLKPAGLRRREYRQ